MKTIEIWEHKIELDIGEVLTVKEFRKIYPLLKQYADNEIEMVIAIIKSFTTTDVEGIIDGLSIEDFTKLSEQIVGLIDQKKK